MEPAKSQLKKGDILPTTGRSKKMADDKSPIGGSNTFGDAPPAEMCGVRSADGSNLGRTVPVVIGLVMGDGDTPFSLVRKDSLISSLEDFKPRRQAKVGQRSCARRKQVASPIW